MWLGQDLISDRLTYSRVARILRDALRLRVRGTMVRQFDSSDGSAHNPDAHRDQDRSEFVVVDRHRLGWRGGRCWGWSGLGFHQDAGDRH